jgi:hypothetical protein
MAPHHETSHRLHILKGKEDHDNGTMDIKGEEKK